LVLKPHALKFKKEKEIEKEKKKKDVPGIFGDTLIIELDGRLAVLSS
jgi:hypothetical protein